MAAFKSMHCGKCLFPSLKQYVTRSFYSFVGTAVRKNEKKVREKLVDEIPRQINSPLDSLATSVVDFLMPVALRLALADGNVDDRERRKIKDFFVNG